MWIIDVRRGAGNVEVSPNFGLSGNFVVSQGGTNGGALYFYDPIRVRWVYASGTDVFRVIDSDNPWTDTNIVRSDGTPEVRTGNTYPVVWHLYRSGLFLIFNDTVIPPGELCQTQRVVFRVPETPLDGPHELQLEDTPPDTLIFRSGLRPFERDGVPIAAQTHRYIFEPDRPQE